METQVRTPQAIFMQPQRLLVPLDLKELRADLRLGLGRLGAGFGIGEDPGLGRLAVMPVNLAVDPPEVLTEVLPEVFEIGNIFPVPVHAQVAVFLGRSAVSVGSSADLAGI